MVFPRPDSCPVRYDVLCRQTVTVYRKEKDGTVSREVHQQAYLDHKKTQTTERTGSREANSFLLIVPGSEQTVYVNDKVFDGVGPEIFPEEWSTFIPSKVPGLLVVSSADPKKWNGHIVHTEAGG